ncbi:hypothetical protein PENSPDRAFT_735160 [Peniophora sp. CONT]|nr:hypothetical protein PENSPDRAFT_735160 [Peniophora sp. CONT]
MAGYSYEIARWTASEAVKKDLGIVKDVVEIMKSKTSLPVFAGINIETAELFWMLTWDKTETHKAFIDSPEYADFMAKFKPTMPEGGAKVDMGHAHFDRDPLPAFESKVTEHALITPKEGEFDAMLEVLKRMGEVLKEHPELSVGAAVGTIEEKPGVILVVIGWHTVEDHEKAAAPGGPCHHFLAELRSKVAVRPEVTHVPYVRQA